MWQKMMPLLKRLLMDAGHFYMANLMDLPLAHIHEKDELQYLGILFDRDHTQKSSQ
jgi:hypothetical protein